MVNPATGTARLSTVNDFKLVAIATQETKREGKSHGVTIKCNYFFGKYIGAMINAQLTLVFYPTSILVFQVLDNVLETLFLSEMLKRQKSIQANRGVILS